MRRSPAPTAADPCQYGQSPQPPRRDCGSNAKTRPAAGK
nr:MAG TPA: hypothetical protein [Caudoviricetes sp.]